jgi:hypothetical protein
MLPSGVFLRKTPLEHINFAPYQIEFRYSPPGLLRDVRSVGK